MYLFLNVGMLHYLLDYTVSGYFWYLGVKKRSFRLHYIIICLKQFFYFSSFKYNLENVYLFCEKSMLSMYLILIYLSNINTRLLMS